MYTHSVLLPDKSELLLCLSPLRLLGGLQTRNLLTVLEALSPRSRHRKVGEDLLPGS